jgi:hypothetical protein
MSGFENRLTWIFGSSRSGSTWLLRMLSELEQVVPIDDPHIGHHLGVWRPIALAWATADENEMPELRTLSDFKGRKRDYLFSDRYRDAWMPALRDLIKTRFEAQVQEDVRTRRIAKPAVVIKEPGSHVAEWLLSMFPRSGLIFLLRDGRDVVDSWLDAYRDGSWATEEGAYPLSEQGRLAMIRWQSSVWLRRTEIVQAAFDRHAPARRVLIRYEQMRRDPVAALAAVCPLLGLEPQAGQLGAIASTNAFERVPDGEKGSGREIRRAEPGSWRETMSAAEINVMHEILGDKLTELGYLQPGDLPPAPIPLARFRRRRRRRAA